ncbi:MAG TPA: AbrB/MazE/SpoVT family DNA-binding domain-containing protein [Candidatus Binatia bacterium]|jgi:AbrB family looped-hinge helix DNA binding protein|nr:AbrB/MazE/SpoVT family DNA-binding domain-containing protein [Candidatus Binatia bacterium]
MKTTNNKRGQTVVPAQIRRQFGLKSGQQLQWTSNGDIIYVIPISKDAIKTFRGSSPSKGLNTALLKARQRP